MAIFRFHRGSLEESLKTCFIVRSHYELRSRVVADLLNNYFINNPKDVRIEITPHPSDVDCFDPRIGWFTQMVIFQHDKLRGPAGFLSEPLE